MSDKYISTVWCTVQVEGLHCWPECPFDEVGYLRDPHRHIFHIKAHKDVLHDDRDVEFIMLKHQIRDFLEESYWCEECKCCDFESMSCEMIARELCEEFELTSCEVSEDGENGCILTLRDEEE